MTKPRYGMQSGLRIRSPGEQLTYEARREEYEAHRLDKLTYNLIRAMSTKTTAQLERAALLIHDDSHALRMAAQAAITELERRMK